MMYFVVVEFGPSMQEVLMTQSCDRDSGRFQRNVVLSKLRVTAGAVVD